MKQIITRLSLVAVLLLLSVSTFAKTFEVDGISYNVTSSLDLTVEVSSKSPKYSGEVVIPESVYYEGKSYSVTSIGSSAFRGCSSLISVTIPNSVTEIGGSAFYGCSELTSVTIPNNVTTIESNVFHDCCNLITATIGNGVETINCDAFKDCSKLKSVTIGSSVTFIDYGVFKGCNKLESITLLTLTPPDFVESTFEYENTFEYGLFSNVCLIVPKGLSTKYSKHPSWGNFNIIYALENGVIYCPVFLEEEGERVVQMKDGVLNGIEVPETESLTISLNGEYADCSFIMLGSSNISEHIKSNGNYTFSPSIQHRKNIVQTYAYPTKDIHISTSGSLIDLIGIENVENTYSLKLSGDLNGTDILAIRKMTNLKLLDLKDANIVDGGMSYYQQYVTSKDALGEYFFKEKDNLVNIILPLSITTIKPYSFESCSGLVSMTIPNNVTEIQYNAFSGCCGLISLTIGNSVTSIGSYAFSGCSGLRSLTIPNSVTGIGQYAFDGCINLSSVTFDCEDIGPWFLSFKYLKEVIFTETVSSIGHHAFTGCRGLTSVTIPNSVTSIGYTAFSGCSSLTSVTIGNRVTSISSEAFLRCSSLTSVKIPNSVTSIGLDAFKECSSLTSVTIPYSVSSIGSGAFSGCSSLTSVAIPTSVTEIDWNTFSGCSSLTSVIIPNSVTTIGWNTFSGCSSLKSITIPNSITSIGCYAFSGCSSLTSITSLNTTPPEIDESTFDKETFENVILYVPKGSKTLYWLHPYWENFKNIVEIEAPSDETIGDVNGDNKVNADDVVNVVNAIMGKQSDNYSTESADVNGDGKVNIADIVSIVNIICNKTP